MADCRGASDQSRLIPRVDLTGASDCIDNSFILYQVCKMSSNTTSVTASLHVRVSAPELRVNTHLINLATSSVRKLLLRTLDDSLAEFQYFSEPLKLAGAVSNFRGYCEPTRSQLRARQTVTEFCGIITSKMSITGAQTHYVPHIVISAIRRYLSRNKSVLQAVDFSYSGPKLNTAYLGWTLNGVQSELSAPQVKDFQQSVANYLEAKTSNSSTATVLLTNQQLVPQSHGTNGSKLTLYTAVFGNDSPHMPFNSLVLDTLEEEIDSFLDTLQRSSKSSLFADIDSMNVFAAEMPIAPSPNVIAAAQPSSKAELFLAVNHIDIKGLYDVRLWVATIVWIVVSILCLAVAIGYTKRARVEEVQVEKQEQAPKKAMAEP